jgi:hypothetical protein
MYVNFTLQNDTIQLLSDFKEPSKIKLNRLSGTEIVSVSVGTRVWGPINFSLVDRDQNQCFESILLMMQNLKVLISYIMNA